MVLDNPAERLLEILVRGKSINGRHNCRQAWQKLLDLEGSSESILMSRLGKVMDLPNQAILLLDSIGEHDDDSHQYWVTKVSNGFMQQNLNSNWESFNNHIDSHAISYLKLCSRLLKSHANVKNLPEDQLENIKCQIQELIQGVHSSDLELSVKQYLVRSLQRIVVSIDEYFVSGAVPLLESIETTFGHAVANKEFREAMNDSDIGEAVWETLFKVSSIVSLSVGFPELAAGASALLLAAS